jgi:hypothetical protein
VPTLKTKGFSKNSLMMHLKHLEKQEQITPKNSRWREIIKIRTETNKIEIKKKTIQEINKTKL